MQGMDKIVADQLPITRQKTGAKRWTEERGEFVQVSYHEEIRHLAFFEIKQGFSRGGHYHGRKEEIFYIASGKIEAKLLDLDTEEKEERIFEKGDRLRILPRCAHLFTAIEDTWVVEYSPQFFDPKDSYPVDLTG
jgi:dTDP-4-dehydrorhamnose 3,5-epimerase-like enzyme